ncbi:hypothetical protein [Rhodoligotrophos defluvii]|uniref:hypothetical protein n=1 Tax=Rhodoligotrophos defluvii TaxID=2561934 RepID=UPI0010C970A8|nr:hypothetical protein [Rhodoligotrophos defluvii]
MTDLAEIERLEQRLRELAKHRTYGANHCYDAAEALASLRKRIAELEAERTIREAVLVERDKTVGELRQDRSDILEVMKGIRRAIYSECARIARNGHGELNAEGIARLIEARRDEVCATPPDPAAG